MNNHYVIACFEADRTPVSPASMTDRQKIEFGEDRAPASVDASSGVFRRLL
jgi:hypothetical protein